jgi:Mg-chelatase subunit ChlI
MREVDYRLTFDSRRAVDALRQARVQMEALAAVARRATRAIALWPGSLAVARLLDALDAPEVLLLERRRNRAAARSRRNMPPSDPDALPVDHFGAYPPRTVASAHRRRNRHGRKGVRRCRGTR